MLGGTLLSLMLLEISAGISYPATQVAAASLKQGDPFLLEAGENQPRLEISAKGSARQTENCAVSLRFPHKVRRWCDLITRYADQHNLSPDLVAAVIWLESGGDPEAVSPSGAVGLMQVMPSDGVSAGFQCANGPCFEHRPSSAELKDPEFNISFGTKLLAGLVTRYGELREALRYYGPPGAGYSYADKVLRIFNQHRNQPEG
jgi:soluble lytic murein transglycosylase-like protein